MANYLTHHFLGAAIVVFGSRRPGAEPLRPLIKKQGAQLEISLATEPEHSGGGRRTLRATLPLDQHGESARDLIIVVNDKLAAGSGEGLEIDLKGHGVFLLGKGSCQRRVAEKSGIV
jgi:hypothetical protein